MLGYAAFTDGGQDGVLPGVYRALCTPMYPTATTSLITGNYYLWDGRRGSKREYEYVQARRAASTVIV